MLFSKQQTKNNTIMKTFEVTKGIFGEKTIQQVIYNHEGDKVVIHEALTNYALVVLTIKHHRSHELFLVAQGDEWRQVDIFGNYFYGTIVKTQSFSSYLGTDVSRKPMYERLRKQDSSHTPFKPLFIY